MELLVRAAPLFWDALLMTVYLSLISFAGGVVLGLLTALARMSAVQALRWLATGYISAFRGTPALVQVFAVYYGLPVLGINVGAVTAAFVALALHSGAYLAEIFRAGIQAIDRGQHEAAHAMGMSNVQTMQRVVLPQAARVVVPPTVNQFTSTVKDTSLAMAITVTELTRVAEIVGASTFRYLEAFLLAAVVYWVLCSLLEVGQRALEKRLGRSLA